MKFRLPPQPGEWIDRNRPLSFRFEGQSYTGYAGDTVSSALAAHGVRMLGRGFKYHRPRGIFSLANHDCNNLVRAGRRTNLRADITPLETEAEFYAVNTFGGLRRDWAKIVDRFGKFLPVGFYYKTFHRPSALFPFWERRMRQMAGLGAVDIEAPRTRTPKDYAFCDVLVVGGGPAGLAAALAAADADLSVILVDENPKLGGSLHYQGPDLPDGERVRSELLAKVASDARIEVRTATVAAGYYADHWLALVHAERMTKARARAVVLATGVQEQPAVFGNNDLPGVLLASAAQRLTRQYAVRPFEKGLVFAANADGYHAALGMVRLGLDVTCLVDPRPEGEPTDLAKEVAAAGVPIHQGAVLWAIPAPGKVGIKGAMVGAVDKKGRDLERRLPPIACDGIVMSVGWAGADGLFCQAGGKVVYDESTQQFLPTRAPAGTFVAGRLAGVYALPDRLADGRRAGQAAACYLGRTVDVGPAPPRATGADSPNHPYPIFPSEYFKNFIDLDEDVQYKDLVHAAQEGFDQIELLKRYSTHGMGPSQGKTANSNAIRVLARVKGQTVGETGATTSRPFVHPTSLAILAGRGFHPRRLTPLHARHAAAGAQFITAGDWSRPAYYAPAGQRREQAISEEVQVVRQKVGLIDVGTLGKIEIQGPGAAEFIERVYTGRFANLKVGGTRYGLMCDESGVIVDDGVVARLGSERFYLSTTTTAAAAVYREMQRLALVWRSQVTLHNATGHFAAMNLAGPKSRETLARLAEFPLDDAAFPYLAAREGRILGVPARVLRVGFVSDLGYEIHVPAQFAPRVWDALLAAGAPYGVRPFGVEAQRVLRLEKGHVIVSHDTDGLTTPREANLAWAVKLDKPFFVGQRSLRIVEKQPLKRVLVCFVLPAEHTGEIPKDCHLVILQGEITGRVTSVARSSSRGQVIGMAYVAPSQAKVGGTFEIRVDGGQMLTATIVAPPFLSPPATGSPAKGSPAKGAPTKETGSP